MPAAAGRLGQGGVLPAGEGSGCAGSGGAGTGGGGGGAAAVPPPGGSGRPGVVGVRVPRPGSGRRIRLDGAGGGVAVVRVGAAGHQIPYLVRPGFSGGGLWSPDYEAVVGIVGQAHGNGDGRAITLHQADLGFPDLKLAALASWSAEAAGEVALQQWGWTLARDPEGVRHWRPRARGVSIDSERGWRFRGRAAALHRIVSWLDRGRAGPAGAGDHRLPGGRASPQCWAGSSPPRTPASAPRCRPVTRPSAPAWGR